jgi:uncharacterized protein (PEP-CTERM system associated)
LGMGDRFFGKTPRVTFSHTRKRSSFSGTYNKRITFQRDLSTQGSGFSDGSGFLGGTNSDGGVDGNGQPIDGFGTDQSISSNSAILDERFTLNYAYAGRPGKFSAFGSYSKQIRAEDGAQADFKDWELTFTPTLSRKYNVVGSIGFEEIKPAGIFGDSRSENFVESENWYYTLRYSRPLNTRLSLSLQYRFTDRRSDEELNEYQENMVRATLNIRL